MVERSSVPGENPTVYLFDLDGTLTRQELLPLIAQRAGVSGMAELTRRTVAGEIPFRESFRRRVEMLADVPVELVAEVVLGVPVHEQLMAWVLERREHCRVVTGNLDCWVGPWLRHWGLEGYTSRSRVEDGRVSLEVGGILEKASVLAEFDGYRTAMVGDGANDAELVRDADLGIAAQLVHTAPEVLIECADVIVNDEETLCRILSRW
ncbi:MAG: HAD-IB family phosphatase [Protaetiibacter sp.]